MVACASSHGLVKVLLNVYTFFKRITYKIIYF